MGFVRTISAQTVYTFVKELGQGGMGFVELVKDPQGHEFVRKRIQNLNRSDLEKEVDITRSLDSHHIINIVDAYCIVNGGYTSECAFIMNQIAEGSLADLLRGIRIKQWQRRQQRRNVMGAIDRPDEKVLRNAFGCLAMTLRYTHEQSVRHKDLKPVNVLIWTDSHGVRKNLLTDFGLARDDCRSADLFSQSHKAGTGRYGSPEYHRNKERSVRSDIFSLGCIYLEILNVLYPDSGLASCVSPSTSYFARISHIHQTLDALGNSSSHGPDFSALVLLTRSMLAEKRDDRPDAGEVLDQIKDLASNTLYICEECAEEEGGWLEDDGSDESDENDHDDEGESDDDEASSGHGSDNGSRATRPRELLPPRSQAVEGAQANHGRTHQTRAFPTRETGLPLRNGQQQQRGNPALAGFAPPAYGHNQQPTAIAAAVPYVPPERTQPDRGLQVRRWLQGQDALLQALVNNPRFAQLRRLHETNNSDVYADPRLMDLVQEIRGRLR